MSMSTVVTSTKICFLLGGLDERERVYPGYHAALRVYKEQMRYVDIEKGKGGCKYISNQQI